MKDKFYILYKTTNLKNDKFYIGVHETFNLDDGYLGSGKRLKNSLYYHGKENFKREILEYFDSSNDMYLRESEVVNEELINDSKCMNLKVGGSGGFTLTARIKGGHIAGNVHRNRLKSDVVYRDKTLKRLDINLAKFRNSVNWKPIREIFQWEGKHHTEETKEKMRKPKNIGKNNSQFGTRWITNGTINKKIKKEEKIPNGFELGRKKK